MPLLMVDLDNTLIDRAAAYRRWAESFVIKHDRPASDVEWLVQADGDGFVPRDRLATMIIDHFDLDDTAGATMINDLRRGMVDHLELDPAVPAALAEARAAGWRLVCVTNGTTEQQQRKIDVNGLSSHLDAVVISEAAGVRKPDPMIFRLAADSVRLRLDDAWMVGDSAAADIVGGAGVGAESAWLHRGREWQHPDLTPTITADSFPAAVHSILRHAATIVG